MRDWYLRNVEEPLDRLLINWDGTFLVAWIYTMLITIVNGGY